MGQVPPDDDQPLDPAQARLIARMRRVMLVSVSVLVFGIALVFGVIGYRVFRNEGSRAAPDATALLPKGARVISTAVAGDRLVVTLDVGGMTEVRMFDLATLKPLGRLRFATTP